MGFDDCDIRGTNRAISIHVFTEIRVKFRAGKRAAIDPASGSWSTTGNLHTAHTATLLPNGKVLVARGQNSTGQYFVSLSARTSQATYLGYRAARCAWAKSLESSRRFLLGAALQSKIEEPVLSDSRTDRKPKIPEWEVLPPENRQSRNLSGIEPLFKWLALIMDGLLRVPGTKIRFGLNPLIDFVPGIGDVSAAFVSTSVLIYAVTRGLPKILLARMALNILINELVGIVPVVGSAFAFWFRANKRNYDLLQRHLELPGRPRKSDWVFVGVVLGLIFVIVCAGLIVSVLVLQAIGRLLVGQ